MLMLVTSKKNRSEFAWSLFAYLTCDQSLKTQTANSVVSLKALIKPWIQYFLVLCYLFNLQKSLESPYLQFHYFQRIKGPIWDTNFSYRT